MNKNRNLRPGTITTGKHKRLKDDHVIDLDKAEQSVSELLDLPIEVEEVRFLQRELSKTGVATQDIDAKLIKERDAREEYNLSVLHQLDTNTLYNQIIIPKGSVVIKLFKKPIFELNGFLKPDMIKRAKTDSSGQERGFYYEENKFPYLDAGVIVNASDESGFRFGLEHNDMLGAIVSIKLGTRIDQKVAFIDKSEINPTYFEGHIIVSTSDIEFVIATESSPLRETMYEKVLGKVSAKELQLKITKDSAVKPELITQIAEVLVDNMESNNTDYEIAD